MTTCTFHYWTTAYFALLNCCILLLVRKTGAFGLLLLCCGTCRTYTTSCTWLAFDMPWMGWHSWVSCEIMLAHAHDICLITWFATMWHGARYQDSLRTSLHATYNPSHGYFHKQKLLSQMRFVTFTDITHGHAHTYCTVHILLLLYVIRRRCYSHHHDSLAVSMFGS